jgi:hypothetical protein
MHEDVALMALMSKLPSGLIGVKLSEDRMV